MCKCCFAQTATCAVAISWEGQAGELRFPLAGLLSDKVMCVPPTDGLLQSGSRESVTGNCLQIIRPVAAGRAVGPRPANPGGHPVESALPQVFRLEEEKMLLGDMTN